MRLTPTNINQFRRSARAIVITKNNKILLIERKKKGLLPYFVTPGGGIEANETSVDALKRELLEETGSIVDNISFLFHLDDYEMHNSVDFYICTEIKRETPIGSEWKESSHENSYTIYEASIDEVDRLNLKPEIAATRLIIAAKKAIKNEKKA
jgi:ADP-ribose pyrophosphatase YjhB (NUDIX family)